MSGGGPEGLSWWTCDFSAGGGFTLSVSVCSSPPDSGGESGVARGAFRGHVDDWLTLGRVENVAVTATEYGRSGGGGGACFRVARRSIFGLTGSSLKKQFEVIKTIYMNLTNK